ncbi:MAG: Ycf66 family protein [Synechococcus sp.]|nr:Ycf66 family protein [Synechococcus sp.]
MVNASLNWASIVGIVLAVGGALLYFMRSFKPALARDYDVFFAAVGLLCGGILFFQGWRLDPILQFGQFLLAGTTVFFAYESVRLRGVTTEQARRSSYFDEEEPPEPFRPRMGGGRSWDDDVDRFEAPSSPRRRIRARGPEDEEADDFYRPSRASRAAIPERAASRRGAPDENWSASRGGAAPRSDDREGPWGRGETPRTSSFGSSRPETSDFGARRRERDAGPAPRRGSRPPAAEPMPRSSRRPSAPGGPGSTEGPVGSAAPSTPPGVPQGTAYRARPEAPASPAGAPEVSDAAFTPVRRGEPGGRAEAGGRSEAEGRPSRSPGPAGPRSSSPRDNSSRFDD